MRQMPYMLAVQSVQPCWVPYGALDSHCWAWARTLLAPSDRSWCSTRLQKGVLHINPNTVRPPPCVLLEGTCPPCNLLPGQSL